MQKTEIFRDYLSLAFTIPLSVLQMASKVGVHRIVAWCQKPVACSQLQYEQHTGHATCMECNYGKTSADIKRDLKAAIN